MHAELKIHVGDEMSTSKEQTFIQDIQPKQVYEADSPRIIKLTRSPHFGFGFTLRHFIVYPPEPTDDGSEIEGVIFSHSSQPLDTIFVKHVRVGSPAYLAGLTTGDRIVHVNEYNVCDHSYQEIVTVIQRSEITLRLVVVQGQHDILQQVFSNTAHNPQSNLDLKPNPPSKISFKSLVTSVSTGICLSYRDFPSPLSESFEKGVSPKSEENIKPVVTYQSYSSCVSAISALPAHGIMSHSGKSYSPNQYTIDHSSKTAYQAKKKPVPTKYLQPKKNSPLIVDRKQAVYNIGQGIKCGQKNKTSTNPINSSENSHRLKSQSGSHETAKNSGVYEPIMVRIEIKGGVGERKKLEKDPDGRLYEVVHTRLVESDFAAENGPLKQSSENNFTTSVLNHNSLPNVESAPFKSECIRQNVAHRPRSDSIGYDSNKNLYSDRSTQEAISRIKKNVEKKEEFLRRSSDVFCFPPRGAMVYRQYQVCPQKISPRPIWPPTIEQSNESLDKDCSPSEELNIKESMKKSMSFDSQILDFYGDSKPVSLPASPTNKYDQKLFFSSGTNVSNNSDQLPSIRHLVKNNSAKPYVPHIPEETHPKNAKPFHSTLSRIQENLPAASKVFNDNIPSVASTISIPTSTFGSESSLNSSKGIRSLPLAWVAENDRVKQLQIVSTRAKKFEPNNQIGPVRAAPSFELSRISHREIIVSDRKKDYENKDITPSNDISLDKYGLPITYEGLVTYVGNRSNPVGGPKIHCEPPHKYRHGIQDKDRDRSHSVCSHATLWKDRSIGSALVRQHSFHSTIRSHIAHPPIAEYNARPSNQPFVLECKQNRPDEGTSHTLPTRPFLLDLKDRALPAVNDPYASFCSAGAVGTLHKVSTGPYDEAVKSEAEQHMVQSHALHEKKPVSLRDRLWLGDEHDRLVRRVSYLKATSTDRALTDSEVDSDEEKGFHLQSDKRTSMVEELSSPSSFKASIILHGHLNVKLARHRGKRAGDRSWKSVWGVIRGRTLLLYKDKQIALLTPLDPDDQVTLKESEVAVATDYTKKKNVLRLSTPVGSQFLLQAESEAAMSAWLTSLKSATAQASANNKRDLQPPNSFSELPVPPSVISPTTDHVYNLIDNSSYVDSDSLNRSMKNVTTPRRTRSPPNQVPVAKSRKSTDSEISIKSKTWKGRIGRHLKKMQAGSPLNSPSTILPHGASIGVSLEDSPPSSENELIPLIVSLCVGVVESKGLNTQGIYRIPGNKAAVNHLIEMVNQGPEAIDLIDPRWSDINVISSLLKQFFQKLPDPLIPSYMYCHFIEASKTENAQQRLIAIKNLIHELPDCHFETMRYLIGHFGRVAEKSDQNKMDVKNLAIVFGPTLIRAADDSVAKMVTDMSHQCRIVESLIAHESWFFNEDEIDDLPPVIENHSLSKDAGVITEMESNSQSLLLNNIAKIEGNSKETKKIVSSLISAANRIHKNRGKKIEEHVTNDIDDYRDSSSRRRISGVSLTTSLPSTEKISASIDSLAVETADKERKTSHSPDMRTKSNSVSMNSSGFSRENFQPIMDSSYLGDEVAIRSYTGLSARTQERIRQFEMETRAVMLQRDILSKQESQKLECNRKKVEDQLQKAKQDMENEDIYDKMAKNPSEIVPRINDLLAIDGNRASNKKTVRFPSCSIIPDHTESFLNSSLTNSIDVATNPSVKVANQTSNLFNNFNKSQLDKTCHLSPAHVSSQSLTTCENTCSYSTISSSCNTLSSVRSGQSSGYGSLNRGRPSVTNGSNVTMTESFYDASPTRDITTQERTLSTIQPHLISSSNKYRKPKKTTKKRSNSSACSKNARETILKHILPFHIHTSPKSIRRDSSTENLTDCVSPMHESSHSSLASYNSRSQSLRRESAQSGLPGLSASNINYSIYDTHEHPLKKIEGNDLLKDMTETFEEKMRNLQHSPFLTVDSIPAHEHYEELKCENYSQEKENSLSLLDAKGLLYRDPSLHRKRSPVDLEDFYNFSQAVAEKDARSGNLRRGESLINSDRRDKSEKRSRELHRIDTQDILREKKPKEVKRSKTQEIHYPIDLIEKFGYELKCRKQNVRQLKEKFERGTENVNGNDNGRKANGNKQKKSRIKRRHTVGGTKDLARVALLRVLEAQKGSPAATWQQIQALVENLSDKNYINPLMTCDGISADLNAILFLVTQPNESIKKHLFLKDSTQKSLHPVLESQV